METKSMHQKFDRDKDNRWFVLILYMLVLSAIVFAAYLAGEISAVIFGGLLSVLYLCTRYFTGINKENQKT